MRIRTIFLIAAALGTIYAVISVMLANVDVLRMELRLWDGVSISVGWGLVGCFAVGFLVTLIAGSAREAGLMLERWRQRRASRKSEEIEEEYSRGLDALLEGREDEALHHFRAVLERDSRHFNTLIKLGEVLRGQGKWADAIEYHRKAQGIKPGDVRPLYALVEDHEAQGDLAKARSQLLAIINIKKNSVVAWRKLRSLHMKQGDWEKALEAHQRVEKQSVPDHPLDAIDRRFGEGIEYEIAKQQLASDRTRNAIAGLRRLIKHNEQFIPAHIGLGEALIDAGQEDEAIRAWHAGFEVTGSPILLRALEEHFLRKEQPLAAIEALKRCIAGARKDTLARFYLGKLYFRLEMLDDAFSVLSALEGRASYAPTLHYLLGRIHERRHKLREAVREYRQVIKELELIQLDYGCRCCGETLMEWTDRCESCGEWNSVEVNFREEMPLEELGLAPAPVYPTAY
jgi:lipopolysaccharide biosynthesis regulator YciM